MMTWIAWSMLISALIAIATSALDRIAGHFGVARRFIWVGATIASIVASLAVAARPTVVVTIPSPSIAVHVAATPITPALVVPGAAVERGIHGEGVASYVAHRAIAWADAHIAQAWVLTSFLLLLLVLRSLRVLRAQRASWRVQTLDGHVVLVSRDAGPAVVGIHRPRIVVPEWVVESDAATRELLLRHEHEHLLAGDTRLILCATLLQVAFPWNAALWWMTRRLRLAIEIDCDARVIDALGRARAYGLMLLTVGERHAAGIPMSAALSERRTFLETRIDEMTKPAERRPIVASLPFAAIALIVLSVGAWTPRPAPRQEIVVVPAAVQPVAPIAAKVPGTAVRPVRAAAPVKPSVVGPAPAVAEVASPVAPVPAMQPRPLRGNSAPRYPDSLRTAGVEGLVTVSFSTDGLGGVDTSSIRVLSSTHTLFASSLRQALASWRFDSQGTVRLACRFLMADTPRSGNGLSETVDVDGVEVLPVVSTVRGSASAPLRESSGEAATAATVLFDKFVAAFNNPDTAVFSRFASASIVAPAHKGMMQEQMETGGYVVLKIGHAEEYNLDFAARQRRDGSVMGGYFEVDSADTNRIKAFRVFYAQGRTLDDAMQRARDYRPK